MDEDEIKPTSAESWLEAHSPGYRYGWVLLLLSMTFVFMASGVSAGWARTITVALQGLTLLAALLASRSGRRLFRAAALLVALAIVGSIASVIVSSSDTPTGVFFALNVLLVGAAPIAIANALVRRGIVDYRTILGAICIYILLGMMFAFVYASIGALSSQPFFAQPGAVGLPDFLYFSFVTLTTVGYGDLTAAADLGRTIAVLEALSGQLYLVTVVSVLVSRMASSRAALRDDVASGGDGAT